MTTSSTVDPGFVADAREWRSRLDMPFHIVRMYLTAKVAAEMLQLNASRNRAMNDKKVSDYRESMRAGRWIGNHPDTIAFDTQGRLIDGQKRLKAICGLDTRQVPVQVSFGNDPESINTIDTQQYRNAGQREWMSERHEWRNQSEASWACATAGRMMAGARDTKPLWSDDQRNDFMDLHIDALRFAVELFASHAVRRVRVAPVMAVFARAYYYEDRELLKRAAYVLLTGDKEGRRELILTKARDELILAKHARNSNAAGFVYRIIARALKSYLSNDGLVLLRDTRGFDPWPLRELEDVKENRSSGVGVAAHRVLGVSRAEGA